MAECVAMHDSSLVGLDEYFRDLMVERVAELEGKLLRADTECRQLRSGLDSYLVALADYLPPEADQAQIFLEAIRESLTSLESRVACLAYQQGMWDGVAWVKLQETGGRRRGPHF
jgi:hypothetical protein